MSGPLLVSQLLWMSLEDLEGVRSSKKELGKMGGGGEGTLKWVGWRGDPESALVSGRHRQP